MNTSISPVPEEKIRMATEKPDEDHIPNAETMEALDEVKRMKADPSLGQTYSSVDAMMEDLLT